MFVALPSAAKTKLVKFVCVGVINTVICLVIIYLLKWHQHWSDVNANLGGYLICICLGFALNGRWTFEESALNSRHLLGYFMVAAVAYLTNLFAVLVSINVLNVPSYYAQLIGVPAFTLTSFYLNKVFVFPRKY